jgi:hypothetical protein
MAFSLGATAGAEPNGAQAGAIHGEVESINAFGTEKSKGSLGGVRIIGLH